MKYFATKQELTYSEWQARYICDPCFVMYGKCKMCGEPGVKEEWVKHGYDMGCDECKGPSHQLKVAPLNIPNPNKDLLNLRRGKVWGSILEPTQNSLPQ